MGEAKRQLALQPAALAVETFGGRVQLRWEEEAAATPLGNGLRDNLLKSGKRGSVPIMWMWPRTSPH